MKKLLGILVLGLLWCNMGFAESALDYLGSKKGSLDSHFKCVSDFDKSIKEEFGFKKIGNDLFIFGYDPENKVYDGTSSTAITYKRKLKGKNIDIFMYYAVLDPTFPLGSVIQLKILVTGKDKKHYQKAEFWIDNSENDKNGSNTTWDEWSRILFKEKPELFNEKLREWTDNTHKFISKKLDFGEPFEYVDLVDPPLEVFSKKDGNPAITSGKCKKL